MNIGSSSIVSPFVCRVPQSFRSQLNWSALPLSGLKGLGYDPFLLQEVSTDTLSLRKRIRLPVPDDVGNVTSHIAGSEVLICIYSKA